MNTQLIAELAEKDIHVSLEEDDRVFKGVGKYKGKSCFIKIAKSDHQRVALLQSLQFSEMISQQNPPFVVSKTLVSGWTSQGLFYKVESLIEGEPLATISKGVGNLSISEPNSYFPTIVEALIWLSQSKVDLLINSYDQQLGASERSLQDRFLRRMINWSEPTTPHLLSLLKIVLKNGNAFTKNVAHGDLTLINMIVNVETKSIAFVDMDLSTQEAPKYYDLVEFGNRLWTRIGRPDLAQKFWTEALKQLEEKQQRIFLQQLLVVGAYRAVGNFYEIGKLRTSDQLVKRRELAISFVDLIVDRQFTNLF